MALDLKQLVTRARIHGWVVTEGTIADVEQAIAALQWTVTPNKKRGQPVVETVRPVAAGSARPASMSATTGTGAQPLHTDGAHHVNPPEFVALSVEGETTVPTRLLSLMETERGVRVSVFLNIDFVYAQNGLFLVKSGDESFLDSVMTGYSKFRYDPICMSPQDQRARETAEFLHGLDDRAVEHQWTPGTVLIVANWFVLHGRGDASKDSEREMKRIAFTPSADFSLDAS